MKKEDIKLIYDTVDVDYIEDNPEDVYDMIGELCSECLSLYSRLECANEQIKPWRDLSILLNKEVKELKKLIK